MVNCKHIVFKCRENDVIFLHLFLLVLHNQKVTVDVLNVYICIVIIIQLVKIGCNNSLLDLVKALEIKVAILVYELLVALLEHVLCLG